MRSAEFSTMKQALCFSTSSRCEHQYLSICCVNHFGASCCIMRPAVVNQLLSIPCSFDKERSKYICMAPCTSASSGYIVLQPGCIHVVTKHIHAQSRKHYVGQNSCAV